MRPRRIYGALIIQNYVKEAAVLAALVGDEGKSGEQFCVRIGNALGKFRSHDILPLPPRRCL